MRTERQQEILQAAMNIVSERGMSKLTIRNVAKAVGVTEPAVYRHFPSKLALLTALLEDLHAEINRYFRSLTPSVSAYPKVVLKDALAATIGGLFQVIEEHPAYAVFFFSEEAFHSETGLRPILSGMMQETLKDLTGFFHHTQKNGACRNDLPAIEMAKVIMGSIRLTITWWHLGEEGSLLTEASGNLSSVLSTLFEPPQ